jgi:hypothetical protein
MERLVSSYLMRRSSLVQAHVHARADCIPQPELLRQAERVGSSGQDHKAIR